MIIGKENILLKKALKMQVNIHGRIPLRRYFLCIKRLGKIHKLF
jgi:hypothetical protein